jgi:uncharacterized membrane protein YgcG
MERRRKLFWLSVAALWLLLFTTPAWAGDCSGPSDCTLVPDNTTKAGTTIAIAAGAAAATRKKKDDDIEYGSGDATDEDALFGSGGGSDGGGSDAGTNPGPLDPPKSGRPSGPPDGPIGDPSDLSGR